MSYDEQPVKYNRGKFMIRGKILLPEKKRLEKKLKVKIDIKGYEYTESDKQIDSGAFFKIKRKIFLLVIELKYGVMSLFKKININE